MAKDPKITDSIGACFARTHGFLVVPATVALLELSRQLGIAAPNPQLFTALAITYAAYRGGYAGGLFGAAVGVGYALYFFSSPDSLFHYTSNNWAKVVVNLITLPAIALLVSKLSHMLAATIRSHSERFIKSASAPILGVDREGRISVWNGNLEAATGWLETEIGGRDLAEMLPDQERRAAIEEAIAAALDGRDTQSLELSLSTKTGKPIQLLMSFTPKLDSQDCVIGVTGVGQNITERKAAENALKESEAKLREILENSPLGIAIVTHNFDGTRLTGNRLFVNSALVRMFGGTSRESFIKAEIGDSWVDQDQLQVVEEVFKKRGELNDLEAERRRMDGTTWWVSMNTRPIRFEGQDCTMVWHFDITERKQSEFELRESEEMLKEAQKIGKIGYWRSNAATGEIEWSDEVYRILGRDPESFEPNLRSLKTVIHPDDSTLFDSALAGTRPGASGSASDFRILTPEGTTKWVHAESRVVRDAEGATLEISGTVQDITERIEAEEALHQAQKMEAVGQLTGGVAHDFNNLLAVIQGNAELLANSDATVAAKADAILRATTRGSELTQRLLAFSRQQPLRPQPIDLADLVTGITELLTRTLGETVEIETTLEPDLWAALADPGQLENALLNLTLNARDAMPGGGKLTIACRNARIDGRRSTHDAKAEPGDYVVLAVTDTGTGMPSEVQGRAFEPFFTTKGVGEGSGLGLSMVYGFVNQSGGHAVIESKVDQGTTVSLYLPKTERASEPNKIPARNAAPEGRRETVLVLEDDPEVRETVVALLESLGYRAIAVGEASKALEVLEHERTDVILSDVVLPGGMTGPQFVEAARSRHPEKKVVFMSGYSAEALKNTEPSGIDAVLLNKPFNKDQLAKALRSSLD